MGLFGSRHVVNSIRAYVNTLQLGSEALCISRLILLLRKNAHFWTYAPLTNTKGLGVAHHLSLAHQADWINLGLFGAEYFMWGCRLDAVPLRRKRPVLNSWCLVYGVVEQRRYVRALWFFLWWSLHTYATGLYLAFTWWMERRGSCIRHSSYLVRDPR